MKVTSDHGKLQRDRRFFVQHVNCLIQLINSHQQKPQQVPRDTMAQFSAEDDKSLLLLTVMFTNDDGSIDWGQIHTHMAPTSKTIKDLQDRLQYLSTTDTSVLKALPADFVKDTGLACYHANTNRSLKEIYEAIEEIFGHLTKSDVLQPSGQKHLNAGEIAPVGVTEMINAVGLTSNDVFADIGSGSGSILAQTLLQTPVRQVIGLEIRSDLAALSAKAMADKADKYPRLYLATVLVGDIKSLSESTQRILNGATVLFTNNLMFEPKDNMDLRTYICFNQNLRAVLVTQRFCGRCSASCLNEFCKQYVEVKVITAICCWKQTPVEIIVYNRKSTNMLDLFNTL
jgi:hypothetical protein